jgi:hypothetical protein
LDQGEKSNANIQPHGNGDLPVFVFCVPRVIGEEDDYAQPHIRSQRMVHMHNGVDHLQHQRVYGDCAFETVSNATHVVLSEGWRKEDVSDFQGLVGIRRPMLCVLELRPRVQHDFRRLLPKDMFFVLLGSSIDVVSNCHDAVDNGDSFISHWC